jgi:Sulfotransferase family
MARLRANDKIGGGFAEIRGMVSPDEPRTIGVKTQLPFAERACFAAGQAKSGTTLLMALLDGHPQLLVLPEETAYFPTALNKFGRRGRRAQFDYLTKESLSRILFGGPAEWEKVDYTHFPMAEFRERFERAAFDPANQKKDLLVIMMETYATVLRIPFDSIARWVEKTPANRRFIPQILERFPNAKILLTLRDPRAILAAQIALEKTRRTGEFSIYYCVSHWLQAAKLALKAEAGELPALTTRYEDLVSEPTAAMKRVCDFLEIAFHPDIVLAPTKLGMLWRGNSATEREFSAVTVERVDSWREELSVDEIGWVEWHCRELMGRFGYEPKIPNANVFRHWIRPLREERPKQYLKSRYYSIRDKCLGPRNK